MKEVLKSLAKINVVKCEPKTARDSDIQERDKLGNALWSTTVKETVFNEEFNENEVAFKKYKSFVDIAKGDHLVNLKVTNIGETKGTFTGVNTFYTIINTVDEKTSVGDIFSLTGVVPPSKRKALAAKTAQMSQ